MAAVTSHPSDDALPTPTYIGGHDGRNPPAPGAVLPPGHSRDRASATTRSSGVARPVATLALPEPAAEIESPTRPIRRTPTVRTGYPHPGDGEAWPVGFSPTGDAPPDALIDVLQRGSHAVRSSKRAEAKRAERAASIAAHVDAQIAAFLSICAAEEMVPPVTVRVVADVPLAARVHQRADRPQEIYALSAAPAARAARQAAAVRGTHRAPASNRGRPRIARRERLRAWPVLYWRCESFPSAGRSLHLFVEPGGRLFEGRDDPWPLTVLGRHVRVWPVDAPAIVEAMAEVDARRCALHLVHGMAHLLWRAGVGL